MANYFMQDYNFPERARIESRSRGDGTLGLVPDNFDMADKNYLVVFDGVVSVDEALKASTEATNAATIAITNLYLAMVTEVYGAMTLVFLTTNPDSAIATRETWKDMMNLPEEYSSEGLKSPEILRAADDSIMFGIGDFLNTDQKILDYANRKLTQAREYGIWRIKRLDQFSDDKNAILGV